MCEVIVKAIKSGGKILLCQNGATAADAQHLVAEMLVRLRLSSNHEAIPALALVQDTAIITANGNDCLFE